MWYCTYHAISLVNKSQWLIQHVCPHSEVRTNIHAIESSPTHLSCFVWVYFYCNKSVSMCQLLYLAFLVPRQTQSANTLLNEKSFSSLQKLARFFDFVTSLGTAWMSLGPTKGRCSVPDYVLMTGGKVEKSPWWLQSFGKFEVSLDRSCGAAPETLTCIAQAFMSQSTTKCTPNTKLSIECYPWAQRL